jgi:hypothetical protein
MVGCHWDLQWSDICVQPSNRRARGIAILHLDVRIIKEPSTAHGLNASRNQYIVSRYFYQPYDIDVSDRVIDYEIGHEVFMRGGDS